MTKEALHLSNKISHDPSQVTYNDGLKSISSMKFLTQTVIYTNMKGLTYSGMETDTYGSVQ